MALCRDGLKLSTCGCEKKGTSNENSGFCLRTYCAIYCVMRSVFCQSMLRVYRLLLISYKQAVGDVRVLSVQLRCVWRGDLE